MAGEHPILDLKLGDMIELPNPLAFMKEKIVALVTEITAKHVVVRILIGETKIARKSFCRADMSWKDLALGGKND